MGACILVTLPLELVLGARVYRQPRRLLAAVGAPFLVFTLWDVWAIGRGHWWFSPTYTTGWVLPGELPVEEVAFFVAVPICALLTFEATKRILGDA
jgi:lycopene cyclase domain-containing protein